MSTPNVDTIYKALRLVPEFDGNSNVLTRFIKLCDQLVQQYMSEEAGYELSNLALLNGILNKCIGPAARTINTNGIPENWSAIRNTLINNFADQRDETSLYNDLALLKQGSSTPQEFYEQCQNIFSTIMTYISLHETIASTIESKRTLYKKLTLQSYLRGLRDPLGSRIRCMRPDTIEQALEFVHEEMNTLYLQQRNEYAPAHKSQSQHQVSPKFSYGLMPPYGATSPQRPSFMPPKPFNMPGPSHTFMPPRQTPPFWRPQPPQFRGPTRTQQIFNAPPPNYNPKSHIFKMPGPKPSTAPQPMSGVSHYVAKPVPPRPVHDWSKFGNPPPSNYFKSREVNFNDYYDQNYCDYSYDDYHHNDYYTQEINDYPEQYYPSGYSDNSHYEQTPPTEPYSVEEVADISLPVNTDFQEVPKSDVLK